MGNILRSLPLPGCEGKQLIIDAHLSTELIVWFRIYVPHISQSYGGLQG